MEVMMAFLQHIGASSPSLGSFVQSVRLWCHEQCYLASDAEQRVCKSAFQREQTTGLDAIFGGLYLGFRLASNRESVPVRVLSRSLVTTAQDSLPDISGSNGTSDLCAPFSRSKTRRDSTFPRGSAVRVAAAIFPASPFACRARCGKPIGGSPQLTTHSLKLSSP